MIEMHEKIAGIFVLGAAHLFNLPFGNQLHKLFKIGLCLSDEVLFGGRTRHLSLFFRDDEFAFATFALAMGNDVGIVFC